MAISRADLLKELLPGLNELFGAEYGKYDMERKHVRNKQAHGLKRVNRSRLESNYKKPPEAYSKKGNA